MTKGTDEIINGDQVLLLAKNQSIYPQKGNFYLLANHGKSPLEIIELQSGSYLGEDDIMNFDVTYGYC